MSAEYSPYVRAALDKKPHLAVLEKLGGDEPYIPHATSQEARELLYNDPFSDVQTTPPKPLSLGEQPIPTPTYQELLVLARRYEEDIELARRVRIKASALWAQFPRVSAPDALEASLVRIDKLEERMRRFKAATGLSREALLRNKEKFLNTSYRMPEGLLARIEEAAAMRGDKVAQTHRFLVECGLILLDERARRYEVWVLQQLQAATLKAAQSQPERKLEAVAEVIEAIEPERYIDTMGSRFERARLELDPLHGAPPAVRELLRPSDAPRALSA